MPQRRRILLVTSPESTRLNEHHVRSLEGMLMEVDTAKSPDEAVKMMDKRPNAVVCDGIMGFQDRQPTDCLHQMIRQKDPGVIFVVIGDVGTISSDIWGNLRDDPNCVTLHPISADALPARLAERVARLSIGI